MRAYSKRSVISLFLILPLLTAAAFGQIVRQRPGDPLPVADAVKALQDAPAYEKAAARLNLVDSIQAVIKEQGSQVLQPLLDAIQNRDTAKDRLYVVNCIIALGELKATDASDLLVAVLSDTDMEYAYQAAVALGHIWAGQPATAPKVQTVNAALLALLYSDLPPPIIFAPATALVEINKLTTSDPAKLTSDQLLGQMDKWVMSRPAALPPMDQLPYQALARLVTVGDDATRSAAIGALRQKRELGAIEPILNRLAAGASGNAAQQMRQLLGELSGVSYPPQDAGNSAPDETAAKWREQWLNALKTKTDARSTQYVWRVLENALRFYAVGPDEDLAKKIDAYYNVLLYQLPGPEAIPDGASPQARDLLAGPLDIKERMAQAIGVIESPPGDFEKSEALSTVEQLVFEPAGPTVGREFLGRLVALARSETNTNLAQRLANVLWRVAAVPLTLDGATVEARGQQLDRWLSDVHSSKPELGL